MDKEAVPSVVIRHHRNHAYFKICGIETAANQGGRYKIRLLLFNVLFRNLHLSSSKERLKVHQCCGRIDEKNHCE